MLALWQGAFNVRTRTVSAGILLNRRGWADEELVAAQRPRDKEGFESRMSYALPPLGLCVTVCRCAASVDVEECIQPLVASGGAGFAFANQEGRVHDVLRCIVVASCDAAIQIFLNLTRP
jgi:hypothetical protein